MRDLGTLIGYSLASRKHRSIVLRVKRHRFWASIVLVGQSQGGNSCSRLLLQPRCKPLCLELNCISVHTFNGYSSLWTGQTTPVHPRECWTIDIFFFCFYTKTGKHVHMHLWRSNMTHSMQCHYSLPVTCDQLFAPAGRYLLTVVFSGWPKQPMANRWPSWRSCFEICDTWGIDYWIELIVFLRCPANNRHDRFFLTATERYETSSRLRSDHGGGNSGGNWWRENRGTCYLVGTWTQSKITKRLWRDFFVQPYTFWSSFQSSEEAGIQARQK